MNYAEALNIADMVISNAFHTHNIATTETSSKSRKPALHQAFKEMKEEDFWSMGFDSLDAMQDATDVASHYAMHRN
jgi:hypothetical protein